MRVRVLFDITKPLVRGFFMKIEGRKMWVTVKCERLPNFCYTSGRIGHVETDYEIGVEKGLHNKYSDALRASPIKQMQDRDLIERE